MFFAYNHHPFENYNPDMSELPLDPIKAKSHKNLQDTGFQLGTEIAELYFFCKTEHRKKGNKLYLSFKSRHPDIIKVAWNGD